MLLSSLGEASLSRPPPRSVPVDSVASLRRRGLEGRTKPELNDKFMTTGNYIEGGGEREIGTDCNRAWA